MWACRNTAFRASVLETLAICQSFGTSQFFSTDAARQARCVTRERAAVGTLVPWSSADGSDRFPAVSVWASFEVEVALMNLMVMEVAEVDRVVEVGLATS